LQVVDAVKDKIRKKMQAQIRKQCKSKFWSQSYDFGISATMPALVVGYSVFSK
jgi:hypothetical protein